jgi:hypothetical protein
MLNEEGMLGVAIKIEDAATKQYEIIKAEFPTTHSELLKTIPEENLKGKLCFMGFYSNEIEMSSRQEIYLKQQM